ncbi:E3 ubiquitin-protein ligase UPL5-like [Phragmites australis]|uniref:E3 ubiquitin-protein ligase UPL5-like n=1 Tax=Phragmites australis TaxID=29695 RepID=UPI002D76F8BE|nr:E3 ubiquitin-protein ligase UPL5-like [Phragmites australis]XP_062200014.1 E3 ubiquitin-protein ligase UPL5-like [Phragmites australis]
MSAAFACLRRPSKRRRDAPDHALPSSKQPLMTHSDAAESSSSASASASGGDGTAAAASSSSSPPASPRTVHFFVRATDSRTIAMHAGRDDTVGAVLDHLAACGYGRDLRLLYAGRQLVPETTLAALRLPTDSTLHLAARLRSTQHPRAWQLASHIAATAAAAYSEAATTVTSACSLDELVKEFIICAHGDNPGLPHHDRGASGDARATGDHAAEYLDIFLQAGAALALVRLYLSKSFFFRSYAERAIKCFLAADPSSLPPNVLLVTAPVLLEFCRLLSLAAGKKDLLYKACRCALASVLCSRPWLPPSMNSPTRLIEHVLPFARETVDVVLDGLASVSMMVIPIDLEEFSNFFKVLCLQARLWITNEGPMPKNLYDREFEHGDTWIWRLHNMSMDMLNRVDECLKRLEMDLSLSSESIGVMESQTIWATRSHILAVLTELDFISAIYEDVAHNLQLVLLAHKAPLNALVRCSKRNEHLHWLAKHKNLLSFEARRNLVFMMLPEGKDEFGELHEMLIDRSHLLDESFEYITRAKRTELHGGLFMEFKSEEATGPGVLREWFCLVCQALFSPKQVLFSPCPEDKRRFYLNETSAVDPLHLKYFIFVGRIIGLALMHKVQVGVVLDRTLFLHLAGRNITLEDIAVADPVKYASCKRILEMDAAEIDDLYLTFSRGDHQLGSQRIIDLCPGGQDISVNIRNREHYIDLLIKNTFVDSISAQLTHFTQGFSDILVNPERRKEFFEFLDLEDFDQLLGGSNNTINVQDWRSHTQYNGYKEKDRQIIWFWKVVERMPIEQQRQLLFFWTSVKYLPSDGFCGLSSKLYIYKTSDSPDRLPSSQTCFYRLCLPPYASLKVMENQLQKITQEHVSCSFGTW